MLRPCFFLSGLVVVFVRAFPVPSNAVSADSVSVAQPDPYFANNPKSMPMSDSHISTSARVVLDALHGRRSIRRFTAEPVTRDDIVTMLDAARWAPSGLNNQPWRFLVVRPSDPRQEALAGCTKYARIVRDAGALLAVFLDSEACYHPMKDHQGAGACIQTLLLAAHALGLGAVWLGEIVNQAAQVEEVLGLPAGRYQFMALIAVGHPAQRGSSDRVPLEKLLLEAL